MATFSETDEALMLAYVYGELEANDVRAFERRLDAEPDLRAEVDGMKAAHSLFGRDQEWGLRSGVDVPPPHLVDAIVRSEAMARVPAVREAMLKRGASSSSTLTAKLARWLIGGGVLVAGAAAFVLVVHRAPNADVAMAPMAAAKVAEAPPPPAPPPPPPEPTAAPAAVFDDGNKRDSNDEFKAGADEKPKLTPKAEEAAKDAKLLREPAGNIASRDALDVAGSFSNLKGGAGGGLAVSGASSDGIARLEAAAGPQAAHRGDDAKKATALKEAKQEAKEQALELAKTKAAGKKDAYGYGAKAAASTRPTTEDDDVAETSATAAPMKHAQAMSEAPVATTAPAAPMATTPSERPSPAKPSAPPPAPQTVAKNEAPAADVLSPEEMQARREAVMQKRAAKDKAAPQRVELERQKRAETANLAYMTGMRELTAKNYSTALDALTSAEHIDTDASLGALALVGEMKALVGLKRPADAAKIARRIASRDAKVQGVVDGWLTGVKIAQQIGDDRLERELWTRLLDVPAHHAEAQAALDAMAPRYRAKANRSLDAPADMDAESARPAPAAAPASESKSKE